MTPNEGAKLEHDPANDLWRFNWWGRDGRTYFIQHSEDLVDWLWAPVIVPGDDSVKEWLFTSTADRFFLRLRHLAANGQDPFLRDSDGDGFSDWEELQWGGDPLNAALMPPAPGQPAGVTALWTSPGTVEVTWTPGTGAVQSYHIERQIGTGSWESMASIPGTSTSWIDTTASLGEPTHYRISAANASGTSASAGTSPDGATLPNLSGDPQGDWDGDEVANTEDLYPHDPRRFQDVPVQNYAVIDLGEGLEPYGGLSNSGQIGLLKFSSSGVFNIYSWHMGQWIVDGAEVTLQSREDLQGISADGTYYLQHVQKIMTQHGEMDSFSVTRGIPGQGRAMLFDNEGDNVWEIVSVSPEGHYLGYSCWKTEDDVTSATGKPRRRQRSERGKEATRK